MTTNTVILAGNLVRDPKTFALKDGNGILTRFTIAIDRPRASADYIDCVAFGDTAHTITDHATKGTALKLTGSLRSHRYEQDGVTIYATQVHVDLVQIAAPRHEGAKSGVRGAAAKRRAKTAA